ncbi:MAG: T9SS type A sorting domain-containing protein [Chlorobi bacterium]|nr:T9SS type A sorting domain-containing protein [Chlorobiota bacterium]
MRLSSCFLAVAFAIVSLVAASPARSQSGSQSGDIRLSYDPWQPVLPAEIQIQSGVQSGEWSLAVFGTTERVGDSALPVLVMQLLKDTALSGPQQRLTSDSARPWEYVQVVAVGGRFLVFWKDRRAEGSGVWMRTVDTSGKLGPERKFSEWQFPGQGAMVLDAGGKVRLLWNDTSATGGILMQGIDSIGYPAKEWDFLDSGRASGMMGPFSNGVTAVLRVNDVPLLFDSTGAKIGVGSWSTKFGGKWHVSGDGVMTTVEGDTALLLYRNVLDTVAEQIVRFKINEKISPNSVFPYREDDSLFVMYSKGGGMTYGTGDPIQFSVIKSHVNLDGKIDNDVTLTIWTYWVLSASQSVSMEPINTKVIFWDGLSRIFLVQYNYTWRNFKGGVNESISGIRSLLYVIRNNEVVITDSSDIDKYRQICLNTFTNKEISRRIVGANRWMSNILVNIGDKELLLSTKIAILRTNISEENIGLTTSNRNMFLGWISRGIDTTAELVQWGGLPDTSIASQSILTSESLIGRSVMQSGDRCVAGATYQWIKKTLQGDSTYRRTDLRFPTDTGWTQPVSIDSNTKNLDVQLISWAQHPETKDFLIQFGFISPGYRTLEKFVISFDLNGKQKWRVANPPTSSDNPSLLPVSDSLFFLLSNQDLLLQTDDSLLRSQKLHPDGPYSGMRLFGPYFLRWTPKGFLERFSFTENGTVQWVDSATIQRGNAEFNGVYFVQNPQDSGLAILFTSAKNGVWMLTMNKHLRQVTPLTRIGGDSAFTATPRAIFKNDSLFVVWIDHRNGVADVYGTVVVPQTALAVHDAPVADGGGFRIIPNPVSRRARVELARAISRERELVLHDLSGRQLRQFVVPAGASEEVIDLSGLSAGTYLLHVRGEARGELVVVRE